MHFTEYDTRVAAYAVIVDDAERILLTWYNGEGSHDPGWSLPGGGVDYDETLEQAVVREVREEAGYDVEVGAPLTTQAWGHRNGTTRSDKPYKAVKVLFAATITGGVLGTLEVGGSTDFAEWVPLADLDQRGRRASVVDVGIAAWARQRETSPA
ncbi:NUDIX domain-containing protein [Nocardioides sp.]|uniref:NUDIX domain-containing protein n=1 Tax=Nocardioides sp. TaxID=35761 RepID=UPI002B26D847|nr:NUDIX domain-containing protein [Nocardioides sp.]